MIEDDNRVYNKWWHGYNSYFLNDVLSVEEKSELIKAMCLRFEEGIELTDFNSGMVKLLYVQFISQVNRDDKDWEEDHDQKAKAAYVKHAIDLYTKILKRDINAKMRENISFWIMNNIVPKELLGYLFEITANSSNKTDGMIIELVNYCKEYNITTIEEYKKRVPEQK